MLVLGLVLVEWWPILGRNICSQERMRARRMNKNAITVIGIYRKNISETTGSAAAHEKNLLVLLLCILQQYKQYFDKTRNRTIELVELS